jgi:hypothetical protein
VKELNRNKIKEFPAYSFIFHSAIINTIIRYKKHKYQDIYQNTMALAVQVTNIYIYNYYKTKLLPDFFVAIYLQYTIKKNKVG